METKTSPTPLKREALASWECPPTARFYRYFQLFPATVPQVASKFISADLLHHHPDYCFQAQLPGFFVFFPPLFDYISRANEYKAKPFGRA